MKIRIRRLHPHVSLPAYHTNGSAAFDLAASEPVSVAPGEMSLIPTGLVIEVPQGMFLGVFARSSTPLKRGLVVANGVGIVDSDYCGPRDEVRIAVLNVTSAQVTINRGDRIAQGKMDGSEYNFEGRCEECHRIPPNACALCQHIRLATETSTNGFFADRSSDDRIDFPF